MADQKRWFKVWTSITSDDDFDPSRPNGLLSLGRFTILGAYTALHGERGVLKIMPDTLLRLLNVTELVTVRGDLAFKNVSFEEGKNHHGKITVTWAKWVKYQEDSTQAERQKASRAKRRREEIREEEIRREEIRREEKDYSPPATQAGDSSLDTTVNAKAKTWKVEKNQQANLWLEMLNRETSKKFRSVEANLRPIRARLQEGYTLEEAEQVVRCKIGKWQDDPKMEEYLRPVTLFGTKFDSYLAEAVSDNGTSGPKKRLSPALEAVRIRREQRKQEEKENG